MTSRKLFGTDGIRGKANKFPMVPEVAMNLGRAVIHYFSQFNRNRSKSPVIVIGKDTRLSCYMFENALVAGVCSQGGRAILTGPLPTPGVAFVTKSMRACAGIIISASHNSFDDNGIKIFDQDGRKLPDEIELELEEMILNPDSIPVLTDDKLGSVKRLDEVHGRYIVHVKQAFDSRYNLEGIKLVVDPAHGAAYKVAPQVFEELGAQVIPIHTSPNGTNINRNAGSMHPQKCAEVVLREKADLGICLDGDADRLVVVGSDGRVIHGDKIFALCAKFLKDKKQLDVPEVVGTVMTNMGTEVYLESEGISLLRTKVGDRYILEEMRKKSLVFGGESSGHLIFRNYSTTGDGILAALKVLECMKFYGTSLVDIIQNISLFPQYLENVAVKEKRKFDEIDRIQSAVKKVEKNLGKSGRILLRYSGTESLARIMVEGQDDKKIKDACDYIAQEVRKELGT